MADEYSSNEASTPTAPVTIDELRTVLERIREQAHDARMMAQRHAEIMVGVVGVIASQWEALVDDLERRLDESALTASARDDDGAS